MLVTAPEEPEPLNVAIRRRIIVARRYRTRDNYKLNHRDIHGTKTPGKCCRERWGRKAGTVSGYKADFRMCSNSTDVSTTGLAFMELAVSALRTISGILVSEMPYECKVGTCILVQSQLSINQDANRMQLADTSLIQCTKVSTDAFLSPVTIVPASAYLASTILAGMRSQF